MRSLNTGFEEMTSLVGDFEFDVLGVTETWLRPGTPSDSYIIPGYSLLRSDRQTLFANDEAEESGGGVALYLKEGISHEQYFLSEEVDPGIEYVCVVMRLKGVKLGLCVVYRPSYIRYTRLEALFHALFVDLAIEVNSVVCLGDTNVDLLSNSTQDSKYLRRLLKESNALQLVNEPTRVTATSATLIDHIIVDKSVEVKRTGVIDVPSITDYRGVKISDHKLVFCNIGYRKDKKREPKFIRYRDFSKFDLNQAVTQMSKICWDEAKQMQCVDNIEKFITAKIKTVFDECAPVVCKKVTKSKAPWRVPEIVRLSKSKNKFRNIFWKTRDSLDWERYKGARNKLNGLIRQAKKAFFAEKLANTDSPKEFWNCLRRCDIVGKPKSEKIPPDFNVGDVNKYFVEMGSDNEIDIDTVEFFRSNKKNEQSEDISFTAVSDDEVKSAMNEIKSRAVGIDDISIQMIKAASPYALGAITHLVNKCLENGSFPKEWKTSIVRPLPKITTPTSIQQLRPISILPAMSKIVEKIAIRQIMSHVQDRNILPRLQSGFRRNHSTCTALTNIFSDLFEAKDKGKCSSLVMLDYSQAFDSIDHEMLLAKMSYYGFGEGVTTWLRSYLKERQQVTKLGNETSHPLFKMRGVPQGSCLGPILFNIYTSDFPLCVQCCTAHLYADDCQLHLAYEPEKIEMAISQINSDLKKVLTWSVNNGLGLNISKCTVLHVVPPNLLQALNERGVAVVLGGESLAVCDTVKTLGVELDRGLTFSDHVSHTIQRALGRLRGLCRFRALLPETAKLQLMQSLVLSVLYYCFPAYGNSISKKDMGRVQKLQNSALRFIFNLRRFDHVSSFRDAAHMLPVEAVCKLLTCCMIHKALKFKEPQYLSDRLLFREEVSQRSTRHDGRLHFPKVRLEVGRKGFSYYGPSLFNSLPQQTKILSSSTFKEALKKLFVNIHKD